MKQGKLSNLSFGVCLTLNIEEDNFIYLEGQLMVVTEHLAFRAFLVLIKLNYKSHSHTHLYTSI